MLMPKYKMRVNPESFDLKACRRNCSCYIDPMETLAAGYEELIWDKFEACLQAKWSIGDCVVGCHNDRYNETDSTRRNPHQRRVSKKFVLKVKEKLDNADDFPTDPADFEEIYKWVGTHIETVRKSLNSPEMDDSEDLDENPVMDTVEELSIHICPLLKYDTALRMSYNMAGPDGNLIPSEENHCLPDKKVYLQRGALSGAKALVKITRLSQREAAIKNRTDGIVLKDYLTLEPTDELDGPTIIDISCFSPILRKLGSYHLENFLCIYHQLLNDWANGYEIRINNLEKTQQ